MRHAYLQPPGCWIPNSYEKVLINTMKSPIIKTRLGEMLCASCRALGHLP